MSEAVPVAAPVPEAMLRVQKCVSCAFPVSEGRTLCLDCEKKERDQKDAAGKQKAKARIETTAQGPGEGLAPASGAGAESGEFVPAFLASSEPVKESWLANHVNLLAIAVLVLGILVAVVVFR